MDWAHPLLVLLALPALALLAWWHARSVHPMSPGRRRGAGVLRGLLVLLAVLALAGPAIEHVTDDECVIFVLDHSQSQGLSGLSAGHARAHELAAALPGRTYVGLVSAGASSMVRRVPTRSRAAIAADATLMERDGAQTNLAAAVAVAGGLFPPGTGRRLVLVTDGVETRGDLEEAARHAALAGVVIDAVPVAGASRPDVRVVQLRASRSRLHEGATLGLTAEIESSLAGAGRVRLFENGVEVESRPLEVAVGEHRSVAFRRTPDQRNLYRYRVRVEGFAGDALPENDESMTLVDVRGRPVLLYVEGERGEAHYLAEAMAREGIRLHCRPPDAFPASPQELAPYDGIVLSDVPAYQLGERAMARIRDYVEQLGGGFLMIGGKSSFGVGGYYRTPIEEILPVKIQAPDVEERHATALCLVLDRSGSMEGQKVEICKSAAIATVELLQRKDFVGVVAFDSQARWVVPMTRASHRNAIAAQIATINAGGGTNIYPGMVGASQALQGVRAKVKHMIVLSDGHTHGSNYQALAAQIHAQNITVSTVAVGPQADTALLKSIAKAGGGDHYHTFDPAAIPRIFTQDTMVHMGRLIREEAFRPRQVERHPMLRGWPAAGAPQLLGYVKTNRKATAQVPLVTDLDDPLLAHWRFGLGKATAFTSDCKSRWASLWITGWPEGYSQFWAQVLREMAREPQGRLMDIRLDERGEEARVVVDLLEDPARFRNQATVEADVSFVPANALGSSMQPLCRLALDQTGPGRYESSFIPEKPGVYLVRARSGASMVSAGLVHNVSGEAATGHVRLGLLETVCKLTGGTLLRRPDDCLRAGRQGHSHFVELGPWLLRLLLLLFVADLAIRRWENLLGVAEAARTAWRAARRLVGRH